MALAAGDWTIDSATGDIRYEGGNHTTSPTYATVIEFHRWLQELADDAVAAGDDELDITNTNPSKRSTDNIIELINGYNVTDTEIEHLYDGSISQGEVGVDREIWDGIVNYGNSDVQIQIIQDGAVPADDWWNHRDAVKGDGGLNYDDDAGISHRFMLKVHDYVVDGGDIDGRRIVGTSRTYGNTYGEFKINGTSRGNNVLALTDSTDGNNATAEGTIGALTDIYISRTTNSTTVDGVNGTGQAVLNVVDGGQFTAGDFLMIAGDDAEYQILSIATNALTLNHNLDVATTGSEVLYDLGIGFVQLDVNNNASDEDYYAEWDKGANSINTFYERMKWISQDGSTEYIYGIEAELFRGITHEITVEAPTGTFAQVEPVTWSGGTGQMLAIDSTTAGTLMWMQVLTGIAPVDEETITGDISSATVSCEVGVTPVVDRVSTLKFPFAGTSTGSALDGGYGLSLETADLSNTDKVYDLTNAQITPPNNVEYTASGLVANEDYVLTAPWDGVSTTPEGKPAIDTGQMLLSTSLTADNISEVVVKTGTETAIPTDTPSEGYIRVVDDKGLHRRLWYSSWTGTTFTISGGDYGDGNEDFSGDEATHTTAHVYVAYLDELTITTSISFTGVYASDRDLVNLVRDGKGTPIKEYIAAGTFVSSDSGFSPIRTSDL